MHTAPGLDNLTNEIHEYENNREQKKKKKISEIFSFFFKNIHQ